MIKMADLRDVLSRSGLEDVATYIQSGNVIFSSMISDVDELANNIHQAIKQDMKLQVDVIVLSRSEWARIVRNAPDWWGHNPEWKHNLLVLLRPYDVEKTMLAIGDLKPDIEKVQRGDGVVYQSMSIKLFGRTTTGKLSASPIYTRMTIRNYNTTTKLLTMLDEISEADR